MRGTIKTAFGTTILLLLPQLMLAAEEENVVDSGTTAWMLTSTALVLLMTPGLAMFYGGQVRTKNVLSTMMHSFVAMAIVGVLWVVVGYSLTFGGNTLWGLIGWHDDYFFLKGIDDSIAEGVPEYILAMFQGKFAIFAPALISGALAERVSFRGFCIFVVLWVLLVYCPLAHWVWAADGWLNNIGPSGVIDLAGGLVIHVSAGFSVLAVALFLGPRQGYPKTAMPANNMTMTLMGAGLLWVGWFGFNAGSTIQSGLETARVLTMTQIAAAGGALMWILLEAIQFRKATSLGFVSGMLAGLVAITPAAGVVQPTGALALGALAAIACFFALKMKNKYTYDDSLNCFGIHGIGGGVGVLLLAFFIRDSWMVEASSKVRISGWNAFEQMLLQVLGLGATIVTALVSTLIICVLIEKTVGFRLDEEKELRGLDASLHGEQGYGLVNPDVR